MKTLFNVLSTVAKAITVIFAIIGVILTIAVAIIGKVSVNYVYDVVDECEIIDPDDETQDVALMTEAFSRTIADPRVKHNKFINTVEYGVGRFASFLANL